MPTRIASLLLVALAGACSTAPENRSASEVVLPPGHFVEARVNATPGADLRLILRALGPGSATFEVVQATGQVFAEGNLKLSDLERSYSAEELPLRIEIEAAGDLPVTIEWELRSRAPLDAAWTLPAPHRP